MKRLNLCLMLSISVIVISCNIKNNNEDKKNIVRENIDSTENKTSDLYNPDFYLYINDVNSGSTWSEGGNDYFFRIITIIREESTKIYAERIKLIGESNYEFVSRKSIENYSLDFTNEGISTFRFLKWENEREIYALINNTKYKINLLKMEIVEFPIDNKSDSLIYSD